MGVVEPKNEKAPHLARLHMIFVLSVRYGNSDCPAPRLSKHYQRLWVLFVKARLQAISNQFAAWRILIISVD
jgi:hypothetical protein